MTASPVNRPGPRTFGPPVEQLEKVEVCLQALCQRTGMRCALLADLSGQLASQHGTLTGLDTTTLAALAAGQMAATQAVARLVGEPKGFKQLLQDGETYRVMVGSVGDDWLLVGVVSAEVLLGWVRLVFRQTAEQLAHLLRGVPRVERRPAAGAPPVLDEEFARALADELERVFDGAAIAEPGWERDTP